MSEIEVPLEKIQEDIQHAIHGHGADARMSRAAVTSALLAVLAAISALFAGHYANDAMLEQIQSANSWNYYQAKGIKLAIAELRSAEVGDALAKEKIEQYHHDQEKIKEQAEEKEAAARHNLERHQALAAAVTFFQIGIALTAIALLTRKNYFQTMSIIAGAGGIVFLVVGFLR